MAPTPPEKTVPAPLVLASASARRAQLLESAGVRFEVRVSDVDEALREGEKPRSYALRLAITKARAVATALRAAGDQRPVLAADTIVVVDDLVIGKPIDEDDARRMVSLLSGRVHVVTTAYALDTTTGVLRGHVNTQVEFRPLGDAEIEHYLARAAWHDKAGAYGIQAEAAALVARIAGSHSNVIGLPLAEVVQVLAERGLYPGGPS